MNSTLFPVARCGALTAAALALLISGCATAPATDDAANSTQSAAKDEATAETQAPKPTYRPFELQTLYSLLVADIAVQRNRYDVGLRNYLQQAAETGDAGVARHATLLAELLRAESLALRASQLWATAAPGDAEALQSAAIHEARARDLDQAMAHMTAALELGGSTQFGQLADSAAQLTFAKKQQVLEQMQSLVGKHPENAELWLGVARLEDSLGQTAQALTSAEKSRRHTGTGEAAANQYTSATILAGDLLEKLGRNDEARRTMKTALQQTPDNKRLHLAYARLLTRSDMQAAEAEFEELTSRHPDDPELHFTLALVYRENGELDKAENLLTELLSIKSVNDSVHYYLGLVLEDKKDPDAALQHYLQVTPGRVFISAQARYADMLSERGELDKAAAHLQDLARKQPEHSIDLSLLASDLLIRNGKLERSYDLLTLAMNDHPEDKDLLYARSMLNEKRDDLAGAESDLRQLLALDPDNAAALNALGYTLTVHTKRLDEARELIERAFALNPEDPAIMDSLGWVHFQLGDIDKALPFLRKAHELFPDPEVAAHFGEALWAAGQQQEARAVWRKALQGDPDNTFMKDIVERFGAP